MSAEDDFTAVYRDKFKELCEALHRKFPRLDDSACADLAQVAAMEAIRKIRDENFQPEKDWWTWLLWLTSHRALDYLRQFEAEDDFAAVYRDNFEKLCAALHRKFPRLDDSTCADLAQVAAKETLHKIRDENFQPKKDWWTWLLWLASHRALDYLRQFEIVAFESLAAGRGESNTSVWQPPDPGSPPSQVLAEAERRGRQGLTLSEILAEFCRWRESLPDGYKMKEIYERSLRGQKTADIAVATGELPGTVDVTITRARKWILARTRQADVHRSIFLTLHRRKPEKGAVPPIVGPASQPDPNGESVPSQPGKADLRPGPQAIGNLPTLTSLGDVVRWAIDELGAMCPSLERLENYRRQPNSGDLSDVRYHVDESNCRLCCEELKE